MNRESTVVNKHFITSYSFAPHVGVVWYASDKMF